MQFVQAGMRPGKYDFLVKFFTPETIKACEENELQPGEIRLLFLAAHLIENRATEQFDYSSYATILIDMDKTDPKKLFEKKWLDVVDSVLAHGDDIDDVVTASCGTSACAMGETVFLFKDAKFAINNLSAEQVYHDQNCLPENTVRYHVAVTTMDEQFADPDAMVVECGSRSIHTSSSHLFGVTYAESNHLFQPLSQEPLYRHDDKYDCDLSSDANHLAVAENILSFVADRYLDVDRESQDVTQTKVSKLYPFLNSKDLIDYVDSQR